MKDKLFVVKKYVMARSAADALRKEKRIKPDSVWVDEEWSEGKRTNLAEAVGFKSK
jgi:hypothetical protein